MIKLFMRSLTNKAQIYSLGFVAKFADSSAVIAQEKVVKFMRSKGEIFFFFCIEQERESRRKFFSYALTQQARSRENFSRAFRVKWKVYKSSEILMFICRNGLYFAFETMKNKWLYDVTWLKLVSAYLAQIKIVKLQTRKNSEYVIMLKIHLDM